MGLGKRGGGGHTLSSASCISQHSFAAHAGDICGPHSSTRSVTSPARQQSSSAPLQILQCGQRPWDVARQVGCQGEELTADHSSLLHLAELCTISQRLHSPATISHERKAQEGDAVTLPLQRSCAGEQASKPASRQEEAQFEREGNVAQTIDRRG